MPTFDFTSPDGKTYSVNGPEGATQEQAFAMLNQHLGQAAPATDNSLAGSAKALGSGLANAAIGTLGTSGDVRQLMASGMNAGGNFIGIGNVGDTFSKIAPFIPGAGTLLGGPTSDQIRSAVEAKTGSLDYAPKTGLEGFLKTAGEFAPAALSPGSAVKRAAMVAVPAAASELAGEASQGSSLEPYARAGAAIAGSAAAAGAGKAVLQAIGGLGTHTGEDSLRTAYTAGVKGGSAGQTFRDQLRGNADPNEVIADAKNALSQMRQQKNSDYRAGMTGVNKDPTILDFSDVDSAIQRMNSVKAFKGKELSPATAGVRSDISKTIDEWRQLDPAEYHTPAGFDALKQSIGEIRDSLPFNTPQRLIAEQVYNSIRNTITKQAPHYADVMKGYEAASNQINEIEKTLSLGKKASADTALRKLQSVMRNNVNTNYGRRAELAQTLADNGAPNLMEKLAGQANASWMPRGLGKVVAPLVAGSVYINPYAAAALPFMSPRLMAEAAHALGRVSGAAKSVGNAGRGLLGLPPAGGGVLGNALPLQSLLALQQLNNAGAR